MSKKNSIRRFLCLVLSLVMVASLFIACGKKDDTTGTTENNNTTTNTENTNTGDDTTSGGEEQTETAYFPRPETEELSVWTEWSGTVVASPDEMRSVQIMEEMTNVHIEWVYCSQAEAGERFGLMLASGDYPDIIANTVGQYPGGIVAGYNDGVFMDATELIDEYMPNYKAIIESNPEYNKMTKTDEGMRIGIYQANSYNERIEGENPWIGTVVRKDWLDELGLEVPETLDDWHTALTAMKETYGATMDINSGAINYNHDFISAYGILGGYFQKDGKVYYGPMQDEYLEYLKMMKQWYDEGLINPNFTTYSEWVDPNTNFATNQASAGQIIGSFAYSHLKDSGMAQDENFFLQTVKPAVMNSGDVSQTGMSITEFSRLAVISTNCENPELAARYLDEFYTKEVMELFSYGVEDESYVKNSDGTYSYTDAILHDPDGISAGDMSSYYNLKAGHFAGYYNWGYAPALFGMWLDEAQGIWKVATDLCMPGNMTMTQEETIEHATISTNISTAVTEFNTRFIMGTETEEGFETLRSQLVEYGIEDAIAIQQAALDRYNAR